MSENETDSDDREMGVDFGDLDDELDEVDYPITTDELLDEYGDQRLEFSDGEATLAELIEPMGDQEYQSKNGVQQAVLNMVGDEAIGRKNYSDRTPPATGEDRQEEGAPGQDDQQEPESL